MSDQASAVWKFFARKGAEIVCSLCGTVFSSSEDGSTSALRNHLTGLHKISKERLEAFSGASPAQSTLIARVNKGQVIRVMLKWLLADLRPFSLSNSPYFLEFVALLGLSEKNVPDATNLTRTYLPKLYEIGRRVVCDALRGAASVNCVFDAWTEKYSTRSYVTLSVTVIKDWKLQSLCLTTRHVKESHTAEFLSEWVKIQLREFGLLVRAPLLSATTDTTASMVSTVNLLGVVFIPCLAHTLNLIMKDVFAISALDDFVKRMARICKFVRKSTVATELLETIVNENKDAVLKDARIAYGPLKDESRRKLPKRLKKMVKTRWNSAYDMLVRLWVLYPYVLQMVPRLLARRSQVPDELKEAALVDRDNIQRIRKSLYDLVQATVQVQEQKTPVLGKSLLILFFARAKLEVIERIEIGLSKRIATQVLASLTTRVFAPDSLFRRPQTISLDVIPTPILPAHAIQSAFDVAVLAAALDPRLSKILLSELSKSGLLPPVRGSAHADPVRPHVIALVRNAGTLFLDLPPPPRPAAAEPAVQLEEEVLEEGSTSYWRAKRARVTTVTPEGTLEDQVRQFLDEDIEERHEQDGADPLEYWKTQAKRWPMLALVAARFLGASATSAEAERTFSTAGDIITPQRACLKPKHVDMMLFLAKNIRAGLLTTEHLIEGVKD